MRIASVNQTASGWRPARYFSGWCLIWLATLWVSPSVGAATLLVWTGSPTPAPPYTNWINAAHVIQDAVDLAQAGDTVSVVGGVYATGGRAVYGTMTNRVAITKAITVQSLMGPEVTVIQGYQVPGNIAGIGAIRCVYLTNGAVLSGFTLTNGATGTSGDSRGQNGGGLWCESTNAVVTNCTLTGNSTCKVTGGTTCGGGAWSGTLNNCVLSNNLTGYGGGAYGSVLNNCTITSNSGGFGGGAHSSILNNCLLAGNSASGRYGGQGGGVFSCRVINSVLSSNSATASGGGAGSSTLNNCMLTANSALGSGGGAYASTLNNCAVTGNSASTSGGGVYSGTLNNCTLVGNAASSGGGAACSNALNNCILYYNQAPNGPNYLGCSLNYCCTTPLPIDGTGNIGVEPQLASGSHISAGSPCRGSGSALGAAGVDIDGDAWLNPPSIGCDEYQEDVLTGALAVAISASWTNVALGFTVDFVGTINGRVAGSVWDFGDGSALSSNRPYVSHAWDQPGDYSVALRAYNHSNPTGATAKITIRVAAQSVYFALPGTSPDPIPPFNSWSTAASTLQAAVDAAVPGSVVLASNGVYALGGRAIYGSMTNRVAVAKPIELRSVNGPAVTFIQGGDTRCVYLTNWAHLIGFTLQSGTTRTSGDGPRELSGGGIWCESANAAVNNCILTGNWAMWKGGGAFNGTLNNCVLVGNSARTYGGGAANSMLNNCILRNNSTSFCGGGTSYGTLSNCTLTGNAATNAGGAGYFSTHLNCIHYANTAAINPVAYGGQLNSCWTDDPLFVDWLNGDLRLQANSPCINAGINAFAPGSTDLAGLPRITGGTVDIGAYEFQTPASVISYAWLQHYGLPTDGSADYADPDGDGMNNWQEWRCGTDPTDPNSALRLFAPTPAISGVLVSWQSVTSRSYTLERATNLAATPAFLMLAIGIPGQVSATSFTDSNAPGAGPYFYRVSTRP